MVERLLGDVLTSYGGASVVVTHKLEEVYRLCPQLVVLDQGQIAAAGTREAVFHRPPTVAVARVTECKNSCLRSSIVQH